MTRALLNWLLEASKSWAATRRALAQIAVAACYIFLAACLGAAVVGMTAAALTDMWNTLHR